MEMPTPLRFRSCVPPTAPPEPVVPKLVTAEPLLPRVMVMLGLPEETWLKVMLATAE